MIKDFPRRQQIIKDIPKPDVVCPECGHRREELKDILGRALGLIYLLEAGRQPESTEEIKQEIRTAIKGCRSVAENKEQKEETSI